MIEKVFKAFLLFALSWMAPETLAQRSSTSSASSQASAFYFDETFFPVYVNRNDTGSATASPPSPQPAAETGLGFDLRTTLGVTVWDSLALGLTYNYYRLNTKRGAVTGYEGMDETTTAWEWGPTLAYWWGGARFALTYFIGGERELRRVNKDTSGATTGDLRFTNTDVGGFQFLLGYTIPVWSGFEIGPSLVYRSLEYGKQSKRNALSAAPNENYDGITNAKLVKAQLDAMITLVFKF